MEEGLLIQDGDLLAYKCAAANEKRTVIAKHKETLEELEFDTATAFKEWAGDEKDNYDLTPVQTPQPIAFAINSMKKLLTKIVEGAKCNEYHIVISGDNNFRLDLPLPTRYKDNRKALARPLLLDECKRYLVQNLGAEISDGVEADDVLVGYAYQGYREGKRVVQGTIDKDANSGPSWVYNWETMSEPELIEGFGELICIVKETGAKRANGEPVQTKTVKGKGRIWLYYQMVYGDSSDCYKPCEIAKAKFGEIGAYDLLKNANTDKEALEAVVAKYKIWYPEPTTYQAWDGKTYTKNWLEIMQMYADCAYMRRWEGDFLDVKKVLTKLGIEIGELNDVTEQV